MTGHGFFSRQLYEQPAAQGRWEIWIFCKQKVPICSEGQSETHIEADDRVELLVVVRQETRPADRQDFNLAIDEIFPRRFLIPVPGLKSLDGLHRCVPANAVDGRSWGSDVTVCHAAVFRHLAP